MEQFCNNYFIFIYLVSSSGRRLRAAGTKTRSSAACGACSRQVAFDLRMSAHMPHCNRWLQYTPPLHNTMYKTGHCPTLPIHTHTHPHQPHALHFTALHCTALHCTALHCTALCTALHCTALHCTALCTALHCTALHYTALHCTALCTALHCTATHRHITWHCTSQPALHC